jgi:broad specificity phosphatase PhoE
MFFLPKGVALKVFWSDLRWQLEFSDDFDSQPFFFSVAAIVVPLTILYVASLKNRTAGNILFKLNLFSKGTIHMLFSRDKKWKKMKEDPREVLNQKNTQSKTVIFVRHGESEWNSIFNRGIAKLPPRLVMGWIRETLLLPTRDSIFYDANLNQEGIDQIVALNEFLNKKENQNNDGIKLMNGEGESSVLVCSNLRRAIATAVIGLKHRLQRGEKLHILSSLQEITFNVDGMGLAVENSSPKLNSLYQFFWRQFDPKKVFDTTENYGTKSLSSNGLKRMLEFNEWCFNRSEDVIIVAGGHSLYAREYFKTFLPHGVVHDAKRLKMKNGAAVSFTLYRGSKKNYCVDPKTINNIYLGFAKK